MIASIFELSKSQRYLESSRFFKFKSARACFYRNFNVSKIVPASWLSSTSSFFIFTNFLTYRKLICIFKFLLEYSSLESAYTKNNLKRKWHGEEIWKSNMGDHGSLTVTAVAKHQMILNLQLTLSSSAIKDLINVHHHDGDNASATYFVV